MKISFSINYLAQYGQEIHVLGNVKALGNNKASKSVAMHCSGGSSWTVTVDVKEAAELEYKYILKDTRGNVLREEWRGHTLEIVEACGDYEVRDAWRAEPADRYFYTSAFTRGIFYRAGERKMVPAKAGEMVFKVMAPMVSPGQVVAVVGSQKALGEWNVSDAIVLGAAKFPEWAAKVNARSIEGSFEYKFLIIDKATHNVEWESRENRYCPGVDVANGAVVIDAGTLANPMPLWRGAGVAIPVFSLRSDDDCGVGDFIDLKKMVDWAQSTGQRMIQLLPVNDTTMTHTWTDSYPYNANSTFALHPMYLRPQEIGKLKDSKKEKEYAESFARLNKLATVDYEKANELKEQYTKELFEEYYERVSHTQAYKTFVEANEYWLKSYAVFCALRDEYSTPNFSKWGKMAKYSVAKVNAYAEEHKKTVRYVYFVQYFLDKQLREVRDYAHAHNVVLKGDIPIGISRTSVDAWAYPALFYMESQAGAPPDDFSVQGQNWGFPTYNWDEMARDGFQWWKNRFCKMSEYFDAYRIDHILGFFRIWQIPMTAVHGLLGVFNPAQPFSADELRNNFGFWMHREEYTKPYIRDYMLTDFFGEYAKTATERFLKDKGNGCYELQGFVSTQQKVVEYFKQFPADEENTRLKEALMALIDEVLFIVDDKDASMYHPRIAAQYTYAFRALSDYDRGCFNNLYNHYYYHRHNDFWYGKAMWKLPALTNSTEMLVCGEDLGMIPACVPAVMQDLKILSLEIQRMPKDPRDEFGDPYRYPYTCVCTTSTHDMGGIRAWWEENSEKTQRFFNNVLHEGGEAPAQAEPWVCDRIITAHLESPAMLTVLPLQDWLSIDGDLRRDNPQDEQINIPAISRHYWRYRMHISLEELLRSTEFNTRLHDKIKDSGR